MAQRIQQLIRLLNQQTVERDLGRVARARLGDHPIEPRELRHLVSLVTNPALLVTNLYDLLRLSHMTAGDALPIASLRFWKSLHREEPEVIHRVLQAPDTMKALGDKCLFEHAVGGGGDETMNLEELGATAYGRASQVLEILADDRRLRQFYEAARFDDGALDDDIAFYRRCARKFALYGEILHDFVTASAEREAESAEGEREEEFEAEPNADEESPEPSKAPDARANSLARPRIDLGKVDRDPPALDPADPSLSQLLGDRGSADAMDLLAGLERWALFSSLDVDELHERLDRLIVNQRRAIDRLCDDLCLFGTGTADPRKPTSYFLVGPTGVGKNYLVEQLVEGFRSLWGIEVPTLLIEGPQYTYPSDINELKGAARGFIRSDEEGILTEFHKKSSKAPMAVVLVDEVEKAHSQLRRFFLSVMDRGTVTDNRGKTLNFSNTMFFYTSNIGYSDMARRTQPIGYGDEEARERRTSQNLDQEVKRQLSPEFINRVTMLHFNYLRRVDADRIFDLELTKIAARYREHQGLEVRCTPRAKEQIMELGFNREYGARNLATVLNRIVNIGVSRQLRRDDASGERDVEDVLDAIREMRSGSEDVDVGELEKLVAEAARAKVLYRSIVVDWRDGEFRYEPR